MVRHANAPVLEQDRSLVVDAEEGRSLPGAARAWARCPEESEFPGGAELLFAPLEALAFPVDAVLHARWLGNREAVTRVRRRIVDADVAFSEQLQLHRTARCPTRPRRTASSRASSTPTCSRTSARRC